MVVKPWLIGLEAIDGAWPAVKHFVERAISEGTGRITPDDVFEQLRSGGMQLWALITADGEPEVVAVLVTEIIDYPRRRVLDLALMAGDRMELWIDSLPVLEKWAVANGVDQVQVHGRKGWERVTGYPARAVLLVKELEADHG